MPPGTPAKDHSLEGLPGWDWKKLLLEFFPGPGDHTIMKSFLIRMFVMTASIGITGAILPGIYVRDLWGAVIAALVLAILNTILRPILFFLTLPLNILTLGLFTLILNGFMLYLVDGLVDGIAIASFFWTVLASLCISLVSWAINSMIGEDSQPPVR